MSDFWSRSAKERLQGKPYIGTNKKIVRDRTLVLAWYICILDVNLNPKCACKENYFLKERILKCCQFRRMT